MKKVSVAILILIAFVDVYYFYSQKFWTLSLYRSDSTVMRIKYDSKDSCLSAGNSYMADKTADRFDCGYKCSGSNLSDLNNSPLCKQVCNGAGCR
jgi:hypothetical protein